MSRFQYVRFQLEILQEFSSATEIRKVLLDLPIGLDATYDRILKNIDIKFQDRVINSLKWLAFSKRVLTIKELAEIFIIDPDKNVVFDENIRLFSSSAIFKYFSGLIVTEKGGNGRETARLTHFSVKEYLTSDRIGERLSSAFSFTEADAHMYIVRSCLAYIMHLSTADDNSTEPTDLEETYHLTKYAVKFWAIHLEEVPRAQWPADVSLSAVLALADHSQSLLLLLTIAIQESEAWLRLLIWLHSTYQKTRARENFKHLLKRPHYYTTYSSFRQLTEVMIAEKHGANEYITQEDLDFGLHYGAYGGHLDIV